MNFGETIKAKREALGLSQQQLAEKLFVSRQTVSRWESGSRCPDLIMSKRIAMILGISLDDLIPGEDLTNYVQPKEPSADITCVKVMLTGVMLEAIAAFLIAADSGNMEISGACFILGILVFFVGLWIPFHFPWKAVIDDKLPQRRCPACGQEHDFDYPKCPHCQHDYTAKE